MGLGPEGGRIGRGRMEGIPGGELGLGPEGGEGGGLTSGRIAPMAKSTVTATSAESMAPHAPSDMATYVRGRGN